MYIFQVYRISADLVKRVLHQITETVAEELFRLMSCVTKFSTAGSQQARADVQALQEALKHYTTPSAE